MDRNLTVEELEKLAGADSITAKELNILVSRTRQLSVMKQTELNKLNELLDDLEAKLPVK